MKQKVYFICTNCSGVHLKKQIVQIGPGVVLSGINAGFYSLCYNPSADFAFHANWVECVHLVYSAYQRIMGMGR